MESVDKSLARLGTDYIDLLQLHWYGGAQGSSGRAASGGWRAQGAHNVFRSGLQVHN